MGISQPIAAPSLCEDREGWPCTASLVASAWARQVQVKLARKDCWCQGTAALSRLLGWKSQNLAQDVQGEGR